MDLDSMCDVRFRRRIASGEELFQVGGDEAAQGRSLDARESAAAHYESSDLHAGGRHQRTARRSRPNSDSSISLSIFEYSRRAAVST